MDLNGKVDLRNPELDISVCEDHAIEQQSPLHVDDFRRTLRHVYVGRKVRPLLH